MVQPGPVPVREGDLLAGKYRVERFIGAGGMGIVVAARHEQLGQLVAIKFVRDEALGNEEAIARFLREARSAVKLRSEHVAKVLDVGTLESGAPFMVMEFLDGSDLGQVLQGSGPMTVESAVQMIVQACDGVAEAHAAGIVHRDLKPQNLFLTRTANGSPRLKVLDFGVSKNGLTSDGVGALTRTRAMLGSPLYMAPEQMRSARDVDARADVWALGVVLFELLTRRWPFEAENMPELCLKVVTEPPTPLGELRSDVPPDLVLVVETCLEKDPSKRYANAADLAFALEPFMPVPSRSRSTSRMPSVASQADLASRMTLASANTPIKVSSTAAAWGPTPTAVPSAATPVPSKGPSHKGWIAAIVVAVALVAVLVLASRGHSNGAAAGPAEGPAVQPSVPASNAPSIPAVVQPPPIMAASASASQVAPQPSAAPSASSASSGLGAEVAPPRPSPALPMQSARPVSLKPAVAKPTAKPTPADDDIPALR